MTFYATGVVNTKRRDDLVRDREEAKNDLVRDREEAKNDLVRDREEAKNGWRFFVKQKIFGVGRVVAR